MAIGQYQWLFKVLGDLFLVFLVYLPWIVLQNQQPIKRGFFCGDTNLAYPFKESTVPSALYVTLALGLPLLTIILYEFISKKIQPRSSSEFCEGTSKTKVYQIGKREIPPVVVRCYCDALPFLFGAAVNQTVTNIAKYSLGRLRPHFFAACQPDYNSFNCMDSNGKPQYISDYVCLGTHERRLKQMRLSFPSGHSSLSAYSAVYLVFYLHAKLKWKKLNILRTVLQACLCWAVAGVCVSRISDYKHHWSDVIGGVLLGGTVAFVVALYIAKLFNGPSIKSLLQRLTNVHNSVQRYDLPVSRQENQRIGGIITLQGNQNSSPHYQSNPNQPSFFDIIVPSSDQSGTPKNDANNFTGSGALY